MGGKERGRGGGGRGKGEGVRERTSPCPNSCLPQAWAGHGGKPVTPLLTDPTALCLPVSKIPGQCNLDWRRCLKETARLWAVILRVVVRTPPRSTPESVCTCAPGSEEASTASDLLPPPMGHAPPHTENHCLYKAGDTTGASGELEWEQSFPLPGSVPSDFWRQDSYREIQGKDIETVRQWLGGWRGRGKEGRVSILKKQTSLQMVRDDLMKESTDSFKGESCTWESLLPFLPQ